MGEELGNYVWDTHRQTVMLLSTPTPPVEFWDTHRQTDSNITVHTDPPRSSFGTQTDSIIIWGRS